MVKPRSRAAARAGATLIATALVGSLVAPASASVDGFWFGEASGTSSLTVDLTSPAPVGSQHHLWASTFQGDFPGDFEDDTLAVRYAIISNPSSAVTWAKGSPAGAPGLPSGTYTLALNVGQEQSLYAPGYLTESGWVPETNTFTGPLPSITLAEGQSKTLKVDVPIGGTATFRVLDAHGTPIDAELSLEGAAGSSPRLATTDPTGAAHITGLNTEAYRLNAEVNGASYYLTTAGNRLRLEATEPDGDGPDSRGTRQMTLSRDTALGTVVIQDPFIDVRHSDQFAREIIDMLVRGITTGYRDGSFRPLASVNRDAMAAYLYRMAGSPEYTPPTRSPFTDVARSNQFYKEITWLNSTGITTGWVVGGAREFRPVTPVARDAMAAFLYRFVARFGDRGDHPALFPTPDTSPFTDVSTEQQFFREMAWLRSTEVSTGWSDGTYRPLTSVARDAMSAFIHRTSNAYLG